MDNIFYRVLNPTFEPASQVLSSNFRSDYRQQVFAYRKLSYAIYMFASQTGLRIISAVRVTENIPAFLDVLNSVFQSSAKDFDLKRIMVDDPIGCVKVDDLFTFVSYYLEEANKTGLFYDYGNELYLWELIWEIIRVNEFPNRFSRMESLFLFKEQEQARNFFNEYRDLNFKIAEIEILDGNIEAYDMNWFTIVPSDIPVSEVQVYARRYWSQEMTDNPIKEFLFQGKYKW